MREISFRQPDDWHVHFRDGAVLRQVAPYTARAFGRAVVMPNLTPPVTTAAAAVAYRERILRTLPQDVEFTPLMTCYLTDFTNGRDLIGAHSDGVFFAAKLYPAHATTNSDLGVTSIAKIYDVIGAMAEHGVPLLVHGEITRSDIDVFDREKGFIDEVLVPVLERFPKLRCVLEHVTTEEGVQVVRAYPGRLGATLTPQHLLYSRNALFQGGLRPHLYCLPVLKRERHRLALLAAATSGPGPFFLGTDSAPHLRRLKENACGCAGVFSAPVAVEAYLQAFAQENALDRFEAFASLNGPAFHGLPPNGKTVAYARRATPVAECSPVEEQDGEIVSLFGGQTVDWAPIKGA